MGKRLEKITQDYKNGKMSIVDIAWLITELTDAHSRISDLEECAQIWIKRSMSDSEKLREANECIKELEKQNKMWEEVYAITDITTLKKAPYDDPND
jgi:hypothetical protein